MPHVSIHVQTGAGEAAIQAYDMNWPHAFQTEKLVENLQSYLNQKVVLDLRSPYVCLGKLTHITPDYFTLVDADLHDLRDSPTTRENYIVSAKSTGIKANRKQVIVRADEVVALALFSHVIDVDDEDE
jgi:hypothetical protein